ncbi:hypothetical protein KL86DES1_10315 [uncultured Desulfovibrio sp.]|uniref:Uncharacterized protein n=1 Tax=uncultured Desulfovibrio sp. TaxID=167968 RepID=A0A212KYD2_9BACT|nr:hypothetical protein KL86DES1_10315 [uncultured Desulfovibrio sp.]
MFVGKALWGRDPFAKGSPPPRPHPLKLLLCFSYYNEFSGLERGQKCLKPLPLFNVTMLRLFVFVLCHDKTRPLACKGPCFCFQR